MSRTFIKISEAGICADGGCAHDVRINDERFILDEAFPVSSLIQHVMDMMGKSIKWECDDDYIGDLRRAFALLEAGCDVIHGADR